jgi:hypothetical protein
MFAEPLSAATDPGNTIEPPSPCSIIVGSATRTVFHGPVRLTSSISCHASGSISQVKPPAQIPALGNTMSTRPNWAIPASNTA